MRNALGAMFMVLCATAFAESPIQIGDSAASLFAARGTPERRIDTRDGIILFFDATLVFVKNGVVDFISVGSAHADRLARSEPAPSLRPASEPAATSDAKPWEIIEAAPPDEALVDEQRYQRLAARARRFALTSAYASLDRSFQRALPLAAPAASGSLFGMKDSRGHPLPAHGDTAWSSWYAAGVDLSASVLLE